VEPSVDAALPTKILVHAQEETIVKIIPVKIKSLFFIAKILFNHKNTKKSEFSEKRKN
jgi:hypothetical protein